MEIRFPRKRLQSLKKSEIEFPFAFLSSEFLVDYKDVNISHKKSTFLKVLLNSDFDLFVTQFLALT